MDITIYGNGSAGNHGCEAIVRGTISLLGLNNNYVLQSQNIEDDFKYGLGKLAEIYPAANEPSKNMRFLVAYIKMKLFGKYIEMDGLNYLNGIKKVKNLSRIAFSAGGDNYCYDNTEIYAWLNKAYRNIGVKTILWGCSVEPDVVQKKSVSEDIAAYNMVVARESITYSAIKEVQRNTILAADPAFYMKPEICDVDERVNEGKIIGINISPHIVKCEKNNGITYENYKELIAYILKESDYSVALIPHVVWKHNDDREIIRKLYDEFQQDPRLILVEDHTAPELKYIISKSDIFVGARTHATIAAYSSCVPTLVVGYSVKARGIAQDLFGQSEEYVLPVQELENKYDLKNQLVKIWDNEISIKRHLEKKLPIYMAEGRASVEAIRKL